MRTRTPVIYLGEAPTTPLPFVWGLITGASVVGLLVALVLVWPA